MYKIFVCVWGGGKGGDDNMLDTSSLWGHGCCLSIYVVGISGH
jgi:hypothetical protein